MLSKKRAFFLLLLSILFFSSCTTRSFLRLQKLSDATQKGDFLSSVDFIKKNYKELYGKTNEFLYFMDIGTLYHYAEMYDSSTLYLHKAADVFDQLFVRSVTNEAAALMVNDNVRPYRSKPYELVMLHQFLALNYLATGKIEDALVETRRLQLFFDELQRKNKNDLKYDSDAMFHYISSIAYDGADESSDAMISLYHAIESFKKGPVPLPPPIKNWAYYMFILNGREEDNKLLGIKSDLPKDQIKGIENRATEIVFIGYAGSGPYLDEEVWWGTWIKDGLLVLNHTGADGREQTITLPAPPLPAAEIMKAEKRGKTVAGTTFHIKVALPVVKTKKSITKDFEIKCSCDPNPITTVVINDLDKQAIKYMEDSKNSIIARTVVRVLLRTLAAEKTKEQLMTSSVAANLLLNIGTDLLTDQLEKADTRTCFLLPKKVHIARIPVEAGTYTLEVAARGVDGSVIGSKRFENITVKKNEKKFVFYSSFR
ncbi:MAG: hypothetical protein N2053_09715 [Chitinispirillaceae bacterium]|nr:hypothetical protein [Chitinispirillaceae bacterium]